jgi:hypothetical protein
MRKFTADFETTTDPDDCRVWAYAISEIGDPDNFIYGNNIDEFMQWCELYHNPKVYFHNLKFDSQYVLSWLLSNNFEYIEDKKDRRDQTFTSLITDTGQFYSIEVYFKVWKRKVCKVTFYDSLKIFPNMGVDAVAKGFGLPISKLKIDYKAKREIGHKLTPEEIAYIKNDVTIMSMALDKMFNQGLTKMTIGSDALGDFKARCPRFKYLFPVLEPEIDADIRKSYKGGFTYLNPKYQEKEVGKGIVYDKNSMYPSKMVYCDLPYGYPLPFTGKYKEDTNYPLYVQQFSCQFEIKQGRVPSLQIKNNMSFIPNKYLTSSKGEMVTLTLTSIDLRLFLKQYNVYNVNYLGGWKFKAKKGIFDEYVNYWTEQKIKAKKDNNKSMYQISKLMLNSLYGKFGLNPRCATKQPVLKDGVIHYVNNKPETRDSIYVAMASFITSYAREDIILSSQAITDWSKKKYGEDLYIYSDTDSIHLRVNNHDEDIKELEKVMDVDDYRLGAWKLESEFQRGKYLRQKCYIEQDYEGVTNVTVAGLPKKLSHLINFDNFRIGFTTADFSDEEIGEAGRKLTYKHVEGGVILADTDFTIK